MLMGQVDMVNQLRDMKHLSKYMKRTEGAQSARPTPPTAHCYPSSFAIVQYITGDKTTKVDSVKIVLLM